MGWSGLRAHIIVELHVASPSGADTQTIRAASDVAAWKVHEPMASTLHRGKPPPSSPRLLVAGVCRRVVVSLSALSAYSLYTAY